MAYLSAQRRFRILSSHGFTCRYCGRAAPGVSLEVDHLVPIAAGGSDKDYNLVAACVECNRGKSGQVLDETLLWCRDCCSQCKSEGSYTPHCPVSVEREGNRLRTYYTCPQGHQWKTSWDLAFAIEHSLASKYDSQFE